MRHEHGPMPRENKKQHPPNDGDARQNNGDREQMSALAQCIGAGHQHSGADDIQNENAMAKGQRTGSQRTGGEYKSRVQRVARDARAAAWELSGPAALDNSVAKALEINSTTPEAGRTLTLRIVGHRFLPASNRQALAFALQEPSGSASSTKGKCAPAKRGFQGRQRPWNL